MFNYSFWADEAFISSAAQQLVKGQISFFEAIQLTGITYQKLGMLTTAASFKLFGISELTARIPSMFMFAIGIVIIFFLAKKISNIYGSVIASFIYGLSQLNLAYATQAKPYAAIETITLSIILLFLALNKEKKKKRVILYNVLIIMLSAIATFLHIIALLLWIFYFLYVLTRISKMHFSQKKILLSIIPTILLIFLTSQLVLPEIIKLVTKKSAISHNHLYQVLRLFGYRYFLISLFAFAGFVWTFSKNKFLNISIMLYMGTLFVLVIFVQYIFNIRYVLSIFGILFLYFGVFWGEVAAKYLPKKKWLIPLTIIVIFLISGYRITRTPQPYYNPNIDKYGDVQIANYKDFYTQLKSRHPDYRSIPIFNDTCDTEEWYLDRYANVHFQKSVNKPYRHPVSNTMVYGSLADFRKEMKKYPRGLVIVEDWQSFFPEDIKQYIKQNLKLEYRIESLKEAKDDPWPLALYTWGM